MKEGETLLVLGAAGGVGLATVELGKAMGAKVIAAASTEDKINLCKKHGADEAFIYPSGKLDRDQQKELSSKIKELTGGIGANVVYDPIGDSYSEPCIRATAWDGRYLVIGFAAGEIPKIPINLALLKGMKIVGVFWGAWVGMFPEENKKNFEDWNENVLEHFKNLKPQKFNYKRQADTDEKLKGYIAQDVKDVFPEAYPLSKVKEEDEWKDYYYFNPSGMVVYLMKAVQELSQKVEELEKTCKDCC